MKSICLYCNQETINKYKSYIVLSPPLVNIYSCEQCGVHYTWRKDNDILNMISLYFTINNDKMTMKFYFPEMKAELTTYKWSGDIVSKGMMTLETVTLLSVPSNNLIHLPLQKLKDKITKLMAFM